MFISGANDRLDGELTLSLLLQSAGITRSLTKGGDIRVELGEDAARVQARYLGRSSRSISRIQSEKDLASQYKFNVRISGIRICNQEITHVHIRCISHIDFCDGESSQGNIVTSPTSSLQHSNEIFRQFRSSQFRLSRTLWPIDKTSHSTPVAL